MIRHVVLFRWVADATPGQRASVADALSTLPGIIEEIREYRFGPDAGINEGGWDFAVVADFDDADGYLAYRDHPRHREVVTEVIQPIAADIARVQYRLDD
ncbi:MAG: Dabb family protein [Acidimicrobiia bacterium]|nr:Dabb family protein [Acidimicrobiia bacterium]